MATRVVVLGAGYAGAGAVQQLEDELDDLDAELIWVADNDYHFVLHEAHRLLRDPTLEDVFTVPIDEIKSSSTEFVKEEVKEVYDDRREIEFTDGSTMDYDYVLDCLGSRTAFFGIDGLEDHALTLKSHDEALDINDHVVSAARDGWDDDPAQIVVGGAGLSGIQSAAEIAEFRDAYDAPIEVYLVEAMKHILPGHDAGFQGELRKRLERRDIEILTDDPIVEADDSALHFEARDSLEYDVLLWAGGITGFHEIEDPNLEREDDRIDADATLRTDDDRVFALGDAAVVDQDDGDPPPPTAQAAWDGAEVAGENVARAIRGQSLVRWDYEDKGTLVSVGDDVVAHDVIHLPLSTFGGPGAKLLKKAITARWVGRTASWRRAARAWANT